MKIYELFQKLSYGELSNLSISMEGSGDILESAHNKLIYYINEGLLRLYSRYLLKSDSLLLVQVKHITNYHLVRKYAESSESDEPFHYIKDLPNEQFMGNVIKIIEVYDSFGRLRPLNDKDNSLSYFTPEPEVLQIPFPIEGRPVFVTYQANHAILDVPPKGEKADLNQDIDIPTFLENALQAYVAHKVYSHMNGAENKATSQEHYANYDNICVNAETLDLVNVTVSTSHTKLEKKGFI